MESLPAAALPPPPPLQTHSSVPATPLARVLGFTRLAGGLTMGAAAESMRRLAGGGSEPQRFSSFASEQNAERLAAMLCRMRGAALKLGQIISLQDADALPPGFAEVLDKVRQGADAMPLAQRERVLADELGSEWQTSFASFEPEPFAAASIGQVHAASMDAVSDDGASTQQKLAVKVQFPGVADSIDADLRNFERLATYTNLLPKGLFAEQLIESARGELAHECDYRREAEMQSAFGAKLAAWRAEEEEAAAAAGSAAAALFGTRAGPAGIAVPPVVRALSTERVLTSHFVEGVAINEAADAMTQATRDSVATRMVRLAMKETFEWRLMQTDPNWSNFIYDARTDSLALVDFGATRTYTDTFASGYLQIVAASARHDRDAILATSDELGFLDPEETAELLEAHVGAGFAMGTPFVEDGVFDFGSPEGLELPTRLRSYFATFVRLRKRAPPTEVYTLHRKLVGTFQACIRLRARVPCRAILDETLERSAAQATQR
jgi:aarF domain-containing kinase